MWGSVRVVMAVQHVAQHAKPLTTAQHTCGLDRQCQKGIAHILSIVPAPMGDMVKYSINYIVRPGVK